MVVLSDELNAEVDAACVQGTAISCSLDELVEEAVDWAVFVGENWGPTGKHAGLCATGVGFDASIAGDMFALVQAADRERAAIDLAGDEQRSRAHAHRLAQLVAVLCLKVEAVRASARLVARPQLALLRSTG